MRLRDEVSGHGAHRPSRGDPSPGEGESTLEENARHAAAILKAMSNPSRLVILCQLAEGERSVGELERVVGLSQSGISQHLAVLRRLSMVTSRRVRQTVLYSLGNAEVAALMATLHEVFCRRRRAPQAGAPGWSGGS